MNRQGKEQQLQQCIDSMQRERLPVRDLWPGIEHSLNEVVATNWQRSATLAASIVVVLASSLYFGSLQPGQSSSNSAPRLIMNLQTEHQLNKQALLVNYQDQPPLYQEWEQQMTQLEQAEQVIYQALRDEPENLELLKILRQVQQKQLQLIDSVFSPRLTSI